MFLNALQTRLLNSHFFFKSLPWEGGIPPSHTLPPLGRFASSPRTSDNCAPFEILPLQNSKCCGAPVPKVRESETEIRFVSPKTLFHFRTNEPYFIFGLTNLRNNATNVWLNEPYFIFGLILPGIRNLFVRNNDPSE